MKSELNGKNKSYEPSNDEEFMNQQQLIYFKEQLLSWRESLLKESNSTLQTLKDESLNKPDISDRATMESEKSLELRTRDRSRKLLSKINKALKKISDGTYGYCEETNEPISIERLKARPIATLSLEAQEKHEKNEKTFKEKEY